MRRRRWRFAIGYYWPAVSNIQIQTQHRSAPFIFLSKVVFTHDHSAGFSTTSRKNSGVGIPAYAAGPKHEIRHIPNRCTDPRIDIDRLSDRVDQMVTRVSCRRPEGPDNRPRHKAGGLLMGRARHAGRGLCPRFKSRLSLSVPLKRMRHPVTTTFSAVTCFAPVRSLRISMLAEWTGQPFAGSEYVIRSAAPLETAECGQLSYMDNPKYLTALGATKAGVCVVSPRFRSSVPDTTISIVTPEPYRVYAQALEWLYPAAMFPRSTMGTIGVSERAIVHPSSVSISPYLSAERVEPIEPLQWSVSYQRVSGSVGNPLGR